LPGLNRRIKDADPAKWGSLNIQHEPAVARELNFLEPGLAALGVSVLATRVTTAEMVKPHQRRQDHTSSPSAAAFSSGGIPA
jgi:hypothetical protein